MADWVILPNIVSEVKWETNKNPGFWGFQSFTTVENVVVTL